jgi:glutamate synthase (NADPH/NADH) small chain
LNIQGESLGHVHYAIEYLRNPGVYRLGKTVAVIGAGNVAMDVARTAFRHGADEVYVIARRGEESLAARDIELQFAKIDGAEIITFKEPVRFVDEGVILADTRIEHDDQGNQRVVRVAGTEALFPADSVIIAVGQGPRAVIVSSTTGIEVTDRGLVAVDESGRTSRAGVFASGDVVTGAKTVVEAVRRSKKVAAAMEEYVESLKA